MGSVTASVPSRPEKHLAGQVRNWAKQLVLVQTMLHMMTEAGFEDVPPSSRTSVFFVGKELREKLLSSSEQDGWLPVRVSMPGTRGRGSLGLLLEESIEKSWNCVGRAHRASPRAPTVTLP